MIFIWLNGDGQLAHLAWYLKFAIVAPPIVLLSAVCLWVWRNW